MKNLFCASQTAQALGTIGQTSTCHMHLLQHLSFNICLVSYNTSCDLLMEEEIIFFHSYMQQNMICLGKLKWTIDALQIHSVVPLQLVIKWDSSPERPGRRKSSHSLCTRRQLRLQMHISTSRQELKLWLIGQEPETIENGMLKTNKYGKETCEFTFGSEHKAHEF